MKRFFAILLLGVHLFNLGGYAVLFQYYIHQSDIQMVNRLFDNKIDSKKFTELKVPVHFTTVQDMNEFAVVEGQIKLKNVYYNYVKLKITRDTLFFVCIRNAAKTRLVDANNNTSKELNDAPLNKKMHNEPLAKKFSPVSEYYLQAFEYNYKKFESPLKHSRKSADYSLKYHCIDSPGQPPNLLS